MVNGSEDSGNLGLPHAKFPWLLAPLGPTPAAHVLDLSSRLLPDAAGLRFAAQMCHATVL
jgi:hypothetical protein